MLKLPPPVWVFLYLIIARAVSFAFPWRALLDLRSVWLGVVLVAIGVAMSLWAFLLFRWEGTEIKPSSETNRSLVVRGPFRFTRNPMYLGLVIITVGIAFWVGSLPMFVVPCVTFATLNRAQIPFEEAKMHRQFGAAFEQYMRQVRRWI